MANKTLASLKPNPKNPRTITDKKAKMLQDSLARFGDLSGIVFNQTSGQIVGGHQRVKAFEALGASEVTFTEIYDPPSHTGTVGEGYVDISGERYAYREVQWNENEEKAANLAANKGAGEWNLDQVAEWVAELVDVDFDVDLTMWDADERDALAPEVEHIQDTASVDDDCPELPTEPATKLGDIYSLGRHRLICGDSTDIHVVEKLMAGAHPDMVYTDPPYGMKLNADFSSAKSNLKFASEKKAFGGKKHRNVIGDHEDFTPDLINTVFACFPKCPEIFMWGADYYAELLPDKNGGSWIVWDKRLDDSADKMYGSCFELCWSKARHKRDIARVKWAGVFGTEQEHDRKRHHPTQKPVALAIWFFAKWGKEGDIVVDLYAGSGSTMLACENADRTAYLCELDAAYCDVIVSRYESLTGQKAVLLSSGTAEESDA